MSGTAVLQKPRGLRYAVSLPWRALKLLMAQPNLTRLSLLPAAVGMVFVGIALWAWWVWVGLDTWTSLAIEWTKLTNGSWSAIGWVLVDVVWLPLSMILASAAGWLMAAASAGPIHDQLSAEVERCLDVADTEDIQWREVAYDVLLGLWHTVLGLIIWAALSLIFFILQLLPGIGTLIGAIGWPIVSACLFARETVDFSLSRRRWSFAAKLRLILGRPRESVPYGLMGLVMMGVPVLNVLCLPILVTAGTLWVVELEREGALTPREAAPRLG